MWSILKKDYPIESTSGKDHNSILVPILEAVFGGRVDIQIGSGYLNHTNGYTTKASEAMDFSIKEHVSKTRPSPWLMAYRILCKRALAVPEIYHEFAGLAQMVRSFQAATLVAPIPGPVHEKTSLTQQSQVLYEAYLRSRCGTSFLSLLQVPRGWEGRSRVLLREGGRGFHTGKNTLAVGVRFRYELLDLYHGEFASIFFPHATRMAFYQDAPLVTKSRFFRGRHHVPDVLGLSARLRQSGGLRRLCDQQWRGATLWRREGSILENCTHCQ